MSSTRLSTKAALAVALALAPALASAQCQTSGTSWTNASFAAQTAAFGASFDASPNMAKMDGVTGLSYGTASGFFSLAVIVRFNNLGFIDARNAGAYAAAASIPYAAGSTYHVRLAVDPVHHTYSVYVTPPGGSEQTLGSNYAFRTDQALTSTLSNWALYADVGSHQVCNFTLAGGGSVVPPPAVTFTSPAAGATVSGPVAVSANASSSLGIANVQFQLDGANLGAAVSVAPYATTWNTTTASNAPHTLGAVAADTAGTKATATESVTVSNAALPPPPTSCVTSGTSWQNTSFAAQSAAFGVSFDVTPNMADMDGVTGLAPNAATGFSGLATIVRFNPTGTIDARNGGSYAAAASIPYSPGLTYHVRMAVDPLSHTYSVYVTPPGGSEQTLATGYAFRTEQALTSALNDWAVFADAGTHQVCNVALAAPTAPPPDTTPPTLGITAPKAGATLSGTATISGTAADNMGVVSVTLSVDGGAYAPCSGTTAWSCAVDTTKLTNASHAFSAQAKDAAGNAGTASVSVSVNNAAPPSAGCLTSTTTWQNTAFPTQSAPFGASFDATPQTANMDGVTGLSLNAASGFSSLAALVRFNNTGTIDARNGGAYAAATPIPYSPGSTYHVRLAVYPAAESYSAYVTPPGGGEQTLGSGYAFRTEQALTSTLNDWALYADAGSHQVCNFALGSAPAAAPPTVSITAPAAGATLSGTAAISGTAASAAGIASAALSVDGGAAAPCSGTTAWSCSLNTTGLSNAAHTLTVQVKDSAGNAGTASVSVTVSNLPPAPGTGNYDATVLNDKPIAFWDMKNPTGTETDLTGNGHTGTYQGGAPTLTTLPDGEPVADFNTTASQQQYMTVASPADQSFSIPTTKQLTWEAWIRPDVSQFATNAGSGYVDWMGKCAVYGGNTSQQPCEWEARVYSTTTQESPNRPNRMSGYVFNAGAGLGSAADWQPAYTGPSSNVYASSIVQPKDWLYIVAEYQIVNNGSYASCSTPVGTVSIWVNGVMWSQSNHAPTGCFSQYGVTASAGSSPVNIGTMAMDGWFQGAIGKVAIYNTLLSQSQISAHYTAMTGTQPSGSCGDTCTAAFPLSK